jgi:hypothetical protein
MAAASRGPDGRVTGGVPAEAPVAGD